jgi:uncharacterized membrane protein YdjX (TVP38/TMEM64 family)
VNKRRVFSLLRVGILPAIIVVALIVAWVSGYFDLDRREQLFGAVQQLRLWRGIGVAFLFGYALAASVGLPTALMTILAGGIFGFRVGALLSWSGSLIGTVFAHELARRIARKPVERLFGKHHLLARLKHRGDIRTLAWLRVVPTGPFALLPYLSGIAGVSLKRLLLATGAAIVPSVVVYAYLGAALIRRMISPDDSGKALWIAAAVSIAMPLIALIVGSRSRPTEVTGDS